MRVFGEFNNISDELKALIVPLKPGQYAKYQLLEKITQTDPTNGKVSHRYPHRQTWAKDMIYDSGANDGEGGLVEIGVVAAGGYDAKDNTVVKVEDFVFDEFRTGIMILDGTIAKDREMHEFLQLTNLSQNTVLGDNRDSSIEKLFYLIDTKKESVVKNKTYRTKSEALTYAMNMGMEEMREFAASKNWSFDIDKEVLSAQILEYADTFPAAFKEEIENPIMKKKAIIKYAMAAKMISYDPVMHRILWANGQPLATLERKADTNEVDNFAEWLSTVANGDKILGQLRKKAPVPEKKQPVEA